MVAAAGPKRPASESVRYYEMVDGITEHATDGGVSVTLQAFGRIFVRVDSCDSSSILRPERFRFFDQRSEVADLGRARIVRHGTRC